MSNDEDYTSEDDPQPRFVLCPVEDPVAGADDPRAPDRDEEELH